MEKCKYGCGQDAKSQLRDGSWICGYHPSQCPVNRNKNAKGLTKAHKDGKMRTDHFDTCRNWSKGLINTPLDEIFCKGSLFKREYLRTTIFKKNLLEYKCSICGISEWMNKSIVLDLDHINGTNNDHRLENLRFLCPNCHSQTETYRGRKRNTGLIKVSDEDLLNAVSKYSDIREALLSVGLSGGTGNYERIAKLLMRNNPEEKE